MPSLWGTNKTDNGDSVNGDEAVVSRSSHEGHREPTERDRLLPANPRPPHSDGYLDPDDPAVSPYNLWTVRALRSLTVLFTALTFFWWVLLLVSIFVSPPGLNTRGSGFFDFSFTSLTLGVLLVSLLFFAAPSLAMRVCQGVIALLLFVDLIIIVAVPRIRAEEGAPGIASVVWATVIAIWCVFVDRVVAWGKREEEERLTGRPETRRTLREWLAVLIATIILAVYIVIAVFMTATLVLRARDASLEMYGQRYPVDGGKYEVHLACVGNATMGADKKKDKSNPSPTIILESGEDPSEYNFEHVIYSAYKNGTIDRYCYWDRPGYAFSDNAPSPHSAGMSADVLNEALAIKGEEGPFILVSAGYGTLVSRIFSARQRKNVVGIMLIDPLHEDLLHRVASPTAGFFTWAWGVISPLGVPRVLGALFQGRTREDRVYGRDHFRSGKFIKAKLQENLVADTLTKNDVASARNYQDDTTPLVVISSGIHVRKDDEWRKKQEDLTSITGNLLSWDVVNKAPHYVWQTDEGFSTIGKRLGELVKAGKKVSLEREPEVEEA